MKNYILKNKNFKIIWLLIFINFFLFTQSFKLFAYSNRLSIDSGIANIRSGPGTKHEVLWNVEKYFPIIVLKKKDKWIYFKDFEGDKAWVHSSLTSRKYTVITDEVKCNIRSGPGTNYQIRFIANKGVPFVLLKKKGNWYKIKHKDGDIGWIHKSIVW